MPRHPWQLSTITTIATWFGTLFRSHRKWAHLGQCNAGELQSTRENTLLSLLWEQKGEGRMAMYPLPSRGPERDGNHKWLHNRRCLREPKEGVKSKWRHHPTIKMNSKWE